MSLNDTSSGSRSPAAVAALLVVVTASGVFVGLFANHVPNGGLEMMVLLVALLPALIMGFTRSVYQLPYILAVWALSPEVRRVIDWSYGQFQEISILSILPLVTTLTLLLPIASQHAAVSNSVGRGLWVYLSAIAYGVLVGAVHNGTSMIYDLVSYVVPLLILYYFFQRPFSDRDRDLIIRSFSNVTLLVAGYGWIQYLTAPPWDAFWMVNAAMHSIGSPHPLQIRVFSTLNSPGPAAGWLSLSLCLMIVDKRWRTFTGWLGVGLVASALAITLVRGAWIECAITLACYLALSPSAKRKQTLAAVIMIVLCASVLIPFLPGGDAIASRVDTFGSLHSDNSYNERSATLAAVIKEVAGDPIGKGLGSTGLATKTEDTSGSNVTIDNGFGGLFITFGWLGGIAFFVGLIRIYLAIWSSRTYSPQQMRRVVFAVAYGLAVLESLAVSNSLPGLGGILLWMTVGVALGYAPPKVRVADAAELTTEPVTLSS